MSTAATILGILYLAADIIAGIRNP